jgi:epoxide hydrolase
MPEGLKPFRIEVPETDLTDLRDRLRRTRWPDPEPVDDWSQGIPLAYVQELCRYWADQYGWRATEARLNELPQFRTDIDGLGVHFLHVRSPHAEALPLVITHGWPGSVVEFLKVIGPLTDPPAHGGDAADAFHVVCPSLPGYGFSDKPTEPGWSTERIARGWAELMATLGYGRYGAQGGDWGAAVTTNLGQQDVEHLAGTHINMPIVAPDRSTFGELTEQEQAALASVAHYQDRDSGYSKQQSTRPQTLGYGLVDSPAGVSIFPKEIFRSSRRWAEKRFTDLRYWNELDKGGHFAAFEQPASYVDEIRAFFRLVR